MQFCAIIYVFGDMTLVIIPDFANVAICCTGYVESDLICEGSAIEMFIVLFQNTCFEVYPSLV